MVPALLEMALLVFALQPQGSQAVGRGTSVLVGVHLESSSGLPFLSLGTDCATGLLHQLPAFSNATEEVANFPGNLLRFFLSHKIYIKGGIPSSHQKSSTKGNCTNSSVTHFQMSCSLLYYSNFMPIVCQLNVSDS